MSARLPGDGSSLEWVADHSLAPTERIPSGGPMDRGNRSLAKGRGFLMADPIPAPIIVPPVIPVATTQSVGSRGARFWSFIATCIVLNITLVLAKKTDASIELGKLVIEFEAVTGMTVILGRTGVHLAEAWASRWTNVPTSTTTTTQRVEMKP